MPKVVKRTFSLTEEQARYIDSEVEAGHFVSASEVVRAGLRCLEEAEASIQSWIESEVLPAIAEIDAHPERLIPIDEAFERIEAELKALPKDGK